MNSQLERLKKFLKTNPTDEEIKAYTDNLTFGEKMDIFRETLAKERKAKIWGNYKRLKNMML